MMPKYHTLLIREDNQWSIQFGDYSRAVVVQEAKDSYSDYRKVDRMIITTNDDQASIDAAVSKLNEGHNQ